MTVPVVVQQRHCCLLDAKPNMQIGGLAVVGQNKQSVFATRPKRKPSKPANLDRWRKEMARRRRRHVKEGLSALVELIKKESYLTRWHNRWVSNVARREERAAHAERTLKDHEDNDMDMYAHVVLLPFMCQSCAHVAFCIACTQVDGRKFEKARPLEAASTSRCTTACHLGRRAR